MRKIGPGSRAGCWGCWFSGEALSKGGYSHNTPLVYFVSEEDFPSGTFIKSALLVYYDILYTNVINIKKKMSSKISMFSD